MRCLPGPLSVSLILCLVAVSAGCERQPIGGGADAVPTVDIRVAELDDDGVPTVSRDGSTEAVTVISPTGEAIVPPERRSPPDDTERDE